MNTQWRIQQPNTEGCSTHSLPIVLSQTHTTVRGRFFFLNTLEKTILLLHDWYFNFLVFPELQNLLTV